ncbi:MAG: dihydroneopterin aldolase [Sulfurimonas sp.]|uniref:dihydroneopterin aldolase n=1 Tax=Sulfurimonas sp. TaxID=2022749 RepID=UPI0025EFBB8D|nr:dihydroneopterin aldolase [Sulfurimonas sp.]MCK9490785.1 dihydroneopterin aldolase [Sulfurimonas sp.]
MTIHIEDLKFECIIGILDFERIKPQDVIVNILLEYNYKNGFINYAQIVQKVKDLMIKSEFLLIEDALEAINLNLTKEFAAINSINIKITKPSILRDVKVSVSKHYNPQS